MLLAFAAAAALLTLTPGVDTAVVLRSAAAQGPRAAAAAALGVCGGLIVWGGAAAIGLGALLAASATAFFVLKLVGAAYLFVLGARLIIRPRTALAEGTPAADGAAAALRRGFLTNVLNPKVGVFYATFLPQFIPTGANAAAFSFALAGVHVALTLLWFSALIALTVPLGRILRLPRVIRALDRLTGVVFLGFGAKLALAGR